MTQEQKIKYESVLDTAYRDYGKKLGLHAFFKVHDRAVSEDLVQETFMKTWMYLVRGGRVEAMKAFLYHILNNLIVDEYRKRKTTSLDFLIEKGYGPSTDNSDRLFNVFDGREAAHLIQRLPDKYRKVMRMQYVQDLSLKDISLIIGQSKNTTAVQLHRGLTKLKRLYNCTRKQGERVV